MQIPGAGAPQHFEVLIVGAGISGIAAAYHLQKEAPQRSFVILDAEASFGGTWLTNRFPGIRSDSDLYTFGYSFKPWSGPPIATGPEILSYLSEVVEENDLARHMRFSHRVVEARWSSETNLWTVTAETAAGAVAVFTCRFLFMCQGYFRHGQGHMPDWPGRAEFAGRLVHAQEWHDDLELDGKKVVVVGSGATAATIVPNIAEVCAETTLLQRSPTYFLYAENSNELADRLRALKIDEAWIHEIVRRDILAQEAAFADACRQTPDVVRAEILAAVAAIVGPEITQAHFSPTYRPWRQRVAFLPDADMLHAIADGRASVVTDEIERFTPDGLLLKSGRMIEADVVIAATGFNMNPFGDIAFTVDGAAFDVASSVGYRGMMFTGLPNLAWVFGYFRSSWTLRSDLLSQFVVRLLDHMDARGAARAEVQVPAELEALERRPWIDPENFNPGYLTRALPQLPRSLDHPEWRHSQDFLADRDAFPEIDLDGPVFSYGADIENLPHRPRDAGSLERADANGLVEHQQ